MSRHRVTMIVRAFGRRPSVFSKIRHEPEAPYEIVVCGRAPTPTSLGFTISDLRPVERVAGADTVIVPVLEAPWAPQNPAATGSAAPTRRCHDRPRPVRRRSIGPSSCR